jgi:hypothetical protein
MIGEIRLSQLRDLVIAEYVRHTTRSDTASVRKVTLGGRDWKRESASFSVRLIASSMQSQRDMVTPRSWVPGIVSRGVV